MNTNLFKMALVEIGFSLLIGLLMLFISFSLITVFAKRKYGITYYNTSFAVLKASILFSVGFLMHSVIEPLNYAFRIIVSDNNQTDFGIILSLAGTAGLYFLIGGIYSVVVVVISLKVFTWLTTVFNDISELEEIRKDNLSVGIITGAVVIVMALLLKNGLVVLLESLTYLPELTKFN
jgi:hypothetical protein